MINNQKKWANGKVIIWTDLKKNWKLQYGANWFNREMQSRANNPLKQSCGSDAKKLF